MSSPQPVARGCSSRLFSLELTRDTRPGDLPATTSRQLRKLSIDGRIYLWKVHHRHRELLANGERRYAEMLTAFQREFGRRPVRVLFPATTEHGPGHPEGRGVVVDYEAPSRVINLNRPRIARLLIELSIGPGWTPAHLRGEVVVQNGFTFCARIRWSSTQL